MSEDALSFSLRMSFGRPKDPDELFVFQYVAQAGGVSDDMASDRGY